MTEKDPIKLGKTYPYKHQWSKMNVIYFMVCGFSYGSTTKEIYSIGSLST